MPMELRPLVKKLSLREKSVDGIVLHEGALGDRRVVATFTGMGTRLATAGTERLLDAEPLITRVVVVGITGALDDTPIGTVVWPEVVVDGATGAEHRPAPLGDAAPPGKPEGKMWTSDSLNTDPEELTELRAQGVVALDMETAAIAEVCESRGIPWSVVRVISDRAGDGTIDDEVFHLSNQDGTPNPPAVAKYLLMHPTKIPMLAQLAKGAKLAVDTAADTAIRVCEAL
jgi:nucleoside phosphorylase